MVMYTKANGIVKTSERAKELKFGKTVHLILVTGKMIKLKAKAELSKLAEKFTKANGSMIKLMVLVITSI